MEECIELLNKKVPLVLPYDLERDIFELVALAFPGHAFKLCTLSKYVQEWMEAIMYETVVLDLPLTTVDLFLRTFYSRPASFFAKTVKRLYITSAIDFPESLRIISACSGAITMSCWTDRLGSKDNVIERLSTQRVERLSVKLYSLWGNTTMPRQFTKALFPNLTHLEIVNPPSQSCLSFQVDWEGLRELPKLTHLALGHLFQTVHLYTLPFLQTVFEDCPNLRLLLLLSSDKQFMASLEETGITRDPRVVLREQFNSPKSLVEYWDCVRHGGPDFWTSAEELVAERTSKK
ncbi:hypothetical protein JR316_0001824 [Psilocybe cubensis]|uniref:Uncharacterized protein n=2 Tax=Psilocybe cubensis TaxID=181762 RepID=A0ACB8HB56_PSICU|nr:hypothetical protein JR316_0001824 [Psilocybe cubensis]KAH9484922.1 hypothetical protein JR316_0001824 [Psilocybe cubensis]